MRIYQGPEHSTRIERGISSYRHLQNCASWRRKVASADIENGASESLCEKPETWVWKRYFLLEQRSNAMGTERFIMSSLKNFSEWDNTTFSTPAYSAAFKNYDATRVSVGSAAMFALVFWTIASNLIILVVLLGSRQLRSSSNFLVANLAASDLLLGLTVIPFSAMSEILRHWPLGKAGCVVWLLTDVMLSTASIWSLLLIATDRYSATFYPHWYRVKRGPGRVIISVGAVWIVSALTSVPPLFAFGDMLTAAYRESYADARKCILFDNIHYVLYSACMTFFIPAAALVVIYARILLEIKRRSLMHRTFAASGHHSQKISRQVSHDLCGGVARGWPFACCSVSFFAAHKERSELQQRVAQTYPKKVLLPNSNAITSCTESKLTDGREGGTLQPLTPRKSATRIGTLRKLEARELRATKIMVTLVVCFISCWLPFFSVYIVRSVCSSGDQCTPEMVQRFVLWLGYANSALNPILYALFNEEFRDALRQMVYLSRHGDKEQLHSRRDNVL